MFAMLGVTEKTESRTDKIIKGWKESNWRSQRVEEKLNSDNVVLTMPMEALLAGGRE
jgi:hypothetical protein